MKKLLKLTALFSVLAVVAACEQPQVSANEAPVANTEQQVANLAAPQNTVSAEADKELDPSKLLAEQVNESERQLFLNSFKQSCYAPIEKSAQENAVPENVITTAKAICDCAGDKILETFTGGDIEKFLQGDPSMQQRLNEIVLSCQ